MNLLTDNIKKEIYKKIITKLKTNKSDFDSNIINATIYIIEKLYDSIPDKKRISYGIVYTIKTLAKYIFTEFKNQENLLFEISKKLYKKSTNYKSKNVYLGIISHYGLNNYKSILEIFEDSALNDDWQVREISQMYIRKIIKKYPDEMHNYYLKLVKSNNPYIRRFVAESIRPVQENKWFYNQPDYPLSILKILFQEKDPYPRASVGNNLSDLSRKLPDLVYELVDKLVKSEDKNSYWIAYRACRNLVKKEPISVMNILKIDEYKYKKRIHKRSECI